MNYVRHPSHDRGKPRDLSLSYVAHDRGNTRDQTRTLQIVKSRPGPYLILSYLI